MPPTVCAVCNTNRALILRPKNHQKLCKKCFITVFEDEIHHTITTNRLFRRGEKVAIGASGGKDSTVLASVLKTLNERHDYGLELILLSIDEGIKGYRDDSLETVKRNAVQYAMPLKIVGYDELYGWTMDQVVEQVGKKGNCTYCGVFRRQALDRGAAMLGVQHVVTGHNADDMAETVLMNLLRGDLPRLSRTTSIVTATPSATLPDDNNDIPNMANIKRSKPLKYAYEKEIVLYAHHKSLDYFTTECIYSPEAFRGSARALIKNLERIRPSSILDVVRSGEDMARLVPGFVESAPHCGDTVTGCGSDGSIHAILDGALALEHAVSSAPSKPGFGRGGFSGSMVAAEHRGQAFDPSSPVSGVLPKDLGGQRSRIPLPVGREPGVTVGAEFDVSVAMRDKPHDVALPPARRMGAPTDVALNVGNGNRSDFGEILHEGIRTDTGDAVEGSFAFIENLLDSTLPDGSVPLNKRVGASKNVETHTELPNDSKLSKTKGAARLDAVKQKMGRCERCGYLSSQQVCKACVLLEGLNKSRPKAAIVGFDEIAKQVSGIRVEDAG